MTVIAYTVKHGKTPELLTEAVNAGIQAGFTPTGTLCVDAHGPSYVQGMTKDGSGLGEGYALVQDQSAYDVVDYSGTPLGYQMELLVVSSTSVHIQVPQSQHIISDAEALTIPVTGSYTDTATFTVVNGAITGIVLS